MSTDRVYEIGVGELIGDVTELRKRPLMAEMGLPLLLNEQKTINYETEQRRVKTCTER